MKKSVLVIILLTLDFCTSFSQVDTLKSVSEQIKIERDNQLNDLKDKQRKSEAEIKVLTDKLAKSEKGKAQDKERINDLEKLQIAIDKRLKIIEEAPKTKVNLNGQLALIELLSIQRDLQPANLFLSSKNFFTQIGDVGNLQKYQSFTTWKVEYDNWYSGQNKNDAMLSFINNSINLVGSVANKVPLYGPIVQTVSSGVSSIFSKLGKKDKGLANKTPEMLILLTAASQFETQKAMIDHEWDLINKELGQLQIENDTLLKEQLKYYGINLESFKTKYLNATLDSERDKFKNDCRKIIADKLMVLDSSSDTKSAWMAQIETYMYKVQSLRLRFGQLTNRMLLNIERYEVLNSVFSDAKKFPAEFVAIISGLGKTLDVVRKNFSSAFKPEKYIEDSAVMYIENQ